MSQPLTGQLNHQATPVLRAFHYQFLHSIHVWLDLEDGDRLFLEGAEDFDLVGPSEAHFTQVKHSGQRERLFDHGWFRRIPV